jgi:hypothetical protein
MPAPFFLAALLGKAAAGAASKGLAAKASAHHGHRSLAKRLGGKIVGKVCDEAVDRVLSKAGRAKKRKCERPRRFGSSSI